MDVDACSNYIESSGLRWASRERSMRLLVCLVLALSGCAAALSPEAQRVQVHSQLSNLLGDCKKLGPISAEGGEVWWTEQDKSAKNKLREQAAEMGADTVAITDTEMSSARKLVSMQAVALKCYEGPQK